MIRQKRTQKTDGDRLGNWLSENGAKGWADLLALGLSPIAIDRMVKNQLKGAPRVITQIAICRVTGLKQNELFPFVDGGREEAS